MRRMGTLSRKLHLIKEATPMPIQTATETKEKEVTLPVGSFYVSSKQKNAGLAFVTLEPENIDSYVSFGIVPMEVGDEYPIYRKI